MSDAPSFVFHITRWKHHQTELSAIRKQVFIQEQGVPEELEWDDDDNRALHILAEVIQSGKTLAIGTARIIIKNKQAHIGRMALLPPWRHQGIGAKMLQTCIDECQKQGVQQITLNAQVYALPFYQKAGFQVSSDEFMDAGITHKEMTLTIR